MKKCAICHKVMGKEFGKLKGTMLKIVENNKRKFVYVCSDCQKKEGWIETAKIKGA